MLGFAAADGGVAVDTGGGAEGPASPEPPQPPPATPRMRAKTPFCLLFTGEIVAYPARRTSGAVLVP